jgi:hypothetical protein
MRFYTKKQLNSFLEKERSELKMKKAEYELKCSNMRIKEIYLDYFERMLGVKLDGTVSIEEVDKMFREKTEFENCFRKSFTEWFNVGGQFMIDFLHEKNLLCVNDGMIEKMKKSFEEGVLSNVREIENGKTI